MASTATAKPEADDDPSQMSFHELISLSLQFNGRLDTLWQRVLYSHAAIVGVMVFFGTSDSPFVIARILVFAFYSANVIITLFAFSETLNGLKATIADLQEMQAGVAKTNIQKWVLKRNYERHAFVRLAILGTTWLLLAYLLIIPIL
ncbi:MAG: hypothetical protein AB8B60_16735 [Sulfitobacter sp.]